METGEYADRLRMLAGAKAGDPEAIQALYDRYKVRVVPTTQGVVVRPTRSRVEMESLMDRLVSAIRDDDARPYKEVTSMTNMVECDVCGKQVKAQGLGVHKARAHGIEGARKGGVCPWCSKTFANPHEHQKHCPKRPDDADPPKTVPKVPSVPYVTDAPTVQPVTHAPSCDHCLFRGLERAIDLELVTEAVRGGMTLAGAASFVRRVRETS